MTNRSGKSVPIAMKNLNRRIDFMNTRTIRLKDINVSSNRKKEIIKKSKKLVSLEKNDYSLKMMDYMTF